MAVGGILSIRSKRLAAANFWPCWSSTAPDVAVECNAGSCVSGLAHVWEMITGGNTLNVMGLEVD